MLFDPRFAHSRDETGIRHRLGTRRFATLAEAREDWDAEVARKEGLVGRVLTQTELEKGLARTTPLSDRERRALQRRYQGELNPVALDERTPAVKYRDDLLAEQEAARLAALSPRERRLLRAEKAVVAEQAAAALAQAKDAAANSDAGKRLARELDVAIEFAMLNADVPEADLLELQHQRDLLNRTGDVTAAAANVRLVQQRMLGNAEAQATELRAHADKVAARAAALQVTASEPPKPAGRGDVKSLLT